MSYEQTELLVVRWGEARGIIQNSDSKTQLLKAFSEMGELADAITKLQQHHGLLHKKLEPHCEKHHNQIYLFYLH